MFAALPALQDVSLFAASESGLSAIMDALAVAPLSALRRLHIMRVGSRIGLVSPAPLRRLPPALSELVLEDGPRMLAQLLCGPGAESLSPSLESLTVELRRTSVLEALVDARLPKLRKLVMIHDEPVVRLDSNSVQLLVLGFPSLTEFTGPMSPADVTDEISTTLKVPYMGVKLQR